MHIAHLARAKNELLASVLIDELRFVFREDMRGAIVLLRQLFLPPCHFAGETNDHVMFIGLSVNRDGAECSAFDLHGLTPSFSARSPDSTSADPSGRALLPRLLSPQETFLGVTTATLRRAVEKDRQPALVGVDGAVALRVVRAGDVQLARPELGVRDGHEVVAALHQRRHEAGLAFQDGIVSHVTESQGHKLVDEVRIARSQVVGEVGGDRLLADAPLDLVSKRFGHARLLAVAVGVRLAVFLQLVALPLGALAEHDQRVVAWVGALLLEEQLDQLVEIDLVLRYDAPYRRRVRGVERRKSGIAAKDAENANSLVRADSGALPLDGIAGAGDRGREADAVLGVADVVVHRLRDGDDLDAEVVELGRITERVVAADGDQVFDAEPRKVGQHLAGEVPRLSRAAAPGTRGNWDIVADEMTGQPLYFGRIDAARVQHGAAAPVDGASVFTVQRHEVVRPAGRVLEVQVREGLPPTAETDDLDVVLTAAISHALDDRVEAGDVAAARENADAFSRHAHLPGLACRNNACVPWLSASGAPWNVSVIWG